MSSEDIVIGGLDQTVKFVEKIISSNNKHIPKGIIFYGPPGCGKTLIAKHLAQKAKSLFFCVNGPELLSRYVGQSEANLRQVFEDAQRESEVEKKKAIIFFDEFDSITKSRDLAESDISVNMVSQMLTLMDGVKKLENIVVIGATNRIDAIDPAIRRPGRFDKEIYIPYPDYQARLDIWSKYAVFYKVEKLNCEDFAAKTNNFSGAEIDCIFKEATMVMLLKDEETLTAAHVEQALQNIKPKMKQKMNGDIISDDQLLDEKFIKSVATSSLVSQDLVTKAVELLSIHGFNNVGMLKAFTKHDLASIGIELGVAYHLVKFVQEHAISTSHTLTSMIFK